MLRRQHGHEASRLFDSGDQGVLILFSLSRLLFYIAGEGSDTKILLSSLAALASLRAFVAGVLRG